MKQYSAMLKSNGFQVYYFEAKSSTAQTAPLMEWLRQRGFQTVFCCDPTDYLLTRRLKRYAQASGLKLVMLDSPNFVTSVAEIHQYYGDGRRFFMADFYQFQRKRLQVLVDNNAPVGGKWSFDEDNRKKIPKGLAIPPFQVHNQGSLLDKSKKYIEEEFASNYGMTDGFEFPIDHEGAEKLLDNFLNERFALFGVYQDAIVRNEHFLFHSVISSSLNIGLLSPEQVLVGILAYAKKSQVPINSVEGFIRQLIGWREYIRAVYILKGVEQRTKNFFAFTRPLPHAYWDGTTGITPVDSVITRVLRTAYSHHIERLMIMGNFMLLSEFDPDEVYRWFMTLYIDAYDWVMVPNVYGMSQFADAGMMSTKPYISASNYLLKMSDFKKGEWSVTWDALFWRFMVVHADVLQQNQRLSFLLRAWMGMAQNKKNAHLTIAENYLTSLDKNSSPRLF
jgi:deoxyribodipyrimidine photolyase-related protein